MLLSLITIPIFSIGLLNLSVDPYGIFNTPIISKFNYFKPGQDKHQRLIKSVEVIRYKPKTVLMGSSTVLQGLNPQYLSLNNDSKAHNLGITSANIQHFASQTRTILRNKFLANILSPFKRTLSIRQRINSLTVSNRNAICCKRGQAVSLTI